MLRTVLASLFLVVAVGCTEETSLDAGTDAGPRDMGTAEVDAGSSEEDAGLSCASGEVCDDGDACTQMDRCDEMGMCIGVPRACDAPPAAECIGDVLRSYGAGACTMGDCRYEPVDLACEPGCAVIDGVAQCIVPSFEWAEISAGARHTCARRDDGTVMCWGENADGQLGTGDEARRTAPANVMNLTDAVAISAGGSHTCALRATGQVACWGSGTAGQLGTGERTSRNLPVTANIIDDATFVCTATRYSCALRADRTVWCWGYDTDYTPPILEPRQIEGLSDIVGLDCGGQYECALTAGGEVFCWGYDSNDNLGTGMGSSRTPVHAGGIDDATAVWTGYDVSCAMRPAGFQCWGDNSYGQLARGADTPDGDYHPMNTIFGSETNAVVDFGAGVFHSCAHLADGTVECVGANDDGQLGNRSDSSSVTPTPVYMIGAVRQLEVGLRHACALVGDAIWCWGGNDSGQLGNGGADTMLAPVQVLLP